MWRHGRPWTSLEPFFFRLHFRLPWHNSLRTGITSHYPIIFLDAKCYPFRSVSGCPGVRKYGSKYIRWLLTIWTGNSAKLSFLVQVSTDDWAVIGGCGDGCGYGDGGGGGGGGGGGCGGGCGDGAAVAPATLVVTRHRSVNAPKDAGKRAGRCPVAVWLSSFIVRQVVSQPTSQRPLEKPLWEKPLREKPLREQRLLRERNLFFHRFWKPLKASFETALQTVSTGQSFSRFLVSLLPSPPAPPPSALRPRPRPPSHNGNRSIIRIEMDSIHFFVGMRILFFPFRIPRIDVFVVVWFAGDE